MSNFLPIIYTIKELEKEKERMIWLTSTVMPLSSTTFLFLKISGKKLEQVDILPAKDCRLQSIWMLRS